MSATVKAAETYVANAQTPDAAKRRAQGRVLVVSDVPVTFTTRLEQAGYTIVGASGSMAALVALQRTRAHLIVADSNLKRVGVVELARSLNQMTTKVPLIVVGSNVATVELRAEMMRAGAFDYFQLPAEQDLLDARVGQLVQFAHEVERLRAEAERDYLTGLVNRRRFRTALGHEVERWRRYKLPCALLLLDIDHLKRINDAHGHSAGDTVIRHIAERMMNFSRDNDTAARLGGEEFALLLAGVDERQAFAAAERLRQDIANLPVDVVGMVTVSCGVAVCPAHAVTERNLYALADQTLYEAKRAGRNRTALSRVEQSPPSIH